MGSQTGQRCKKTHQILHFVLLLQSNAIIFEVRTEKKNPNIHNVNPKSTRNHPKMAPSNIHIIKVSSSLSESQNSAMKESQKYTTRKCARLGPQPFSNDLNAPDLSHRNESVIPPKPSQKAHPCEQMN